MAGTAQAFQSLIKRDLKLAGRSGTGGLLAVFFFALVVTMVPFGLGPDLKLLARIAPGMIWVAFILSSLLSLDRLFQTDFEDGSFDLMVLSPLPMEALVLAKCVAHWLTNAVPLLIATPVLALLLNIDGVSMGMVILTLVVGTPGLTLMGAIGAALTVGVRRGGLLVALLIMPLYVPVVIFAVGSVEAAREAAQLGQPVDIFEPNFFFLMALTLGAGVLGPLAGAAGLRLNLS